MYERCQLMFMICESPLHAGTGSDLDFIDNPIQRERHTGYPKIESSSLKGALRERFAEVLGRRNEDVLTAFGPESNDAGSERQGCLGITDARLLLFPVKSMKGVFAWITCPTVLEKFVRDMRRASGGKDFQIHGLAAPGNGEAIVFSEKLYSTKGQENNYIMLEEYALIARDDAPMTIASTPMNEWLADKLFPVSSDIKAFEYWNRMLQENLVVLSDDNFKDFVELSTEVITRNKINPETGTVQDGHLFTEEYLPADSVLYNLIMTHTEFGKNGAGKNAQQVMEFFINTLSMPEKINHAFQVGGNANIGKGLLRSITV